MKKVISKIVSDHWAILLSIDKKFFGPAPFKFEKIWAFHTSFKENVKLWWEECVMHGWEGFHFMKEL